MNNLIADMKRQGADIIDPADLPTHGKFDDTEFLVLLYELRADLNAYLAARPGAPGSLKDIIDFNESNRDKEMPYFGQDIFIKSEAKGTHQQGIHRRPGSESPSVAQGRHRRRDGSISSRRDYGADGWSRVAHRSRQRRSCRRREFKRCRSSRISGYHSARRIRLRAAGRHKFLRPCLERTDVAENRVRLRADDPSAKAPSISADAEAMRKCAKKRVPHFSRFVREVGSFKLSPVA